jgi:general secretion pathway protein G
MRRAPLLLLLGLVLGLVVLVTVVVRHFTGRHDPAEARIHADFATILSAIERYQADGKPLPEEGELDFLVPGYLPQVPADPWGRPYVYSWNGKQPFLASFGADGLRGGHTANEDHTVHDGHQPRAQKSR